MFETILQLDHALTLGFNHFHTDQLDQLMILISGKLTWIPLYALILFLLYKEYGWKSAAVILLAIVVNLVLTDQTSVFFKNFFERPRPCHNEEMLKMLNMPVGCGGKFGFVSSHAANTMGLAVLASYFLQKNWVWLLLLSFALLNAYSRVYLGKHFVGDVVGGMFLGWLIALLVAQMTELLLKKIKQP
jgi:undecaprenyl-diphosphatase